MSIHQFIRGFLPAIGLAASLMAASAQVTFNRGYDGDPETLDPHKTSTTSEAHLLRDLFEGLVIHDAKGEVKPGVAEKWSVSADGKVYTFNLRANAKWSNGDPVKAQDFEFSFKRIMDPATSAKYANMLYPILNAEAFNKGKGKTAADMGVKAVDDRTLQITLERPTAYFLELLTHQTGTPVHPASVQKHGADFVKPGNLVSNGAFTLVENVPNSHIKMTKNAQFHDAANVKIDVVNFIPHKDTAAGVRRFMAGELHVTGDIPADQIKFLREKLGKQVSVAPYLGTYYFAFNMSKAPFNDKRVRQALNMVIDREFLAEQVFQNTMVAAYSFVPPGIANYVGEKAPTYPFQSKSIIDREDAAKKLLADAGFGPNKKLKVEIRYNMTDNNRAAAVAIADMWKQIGVETTFINTDAKTHFAHLRDGGDFDVARAGWIGDYSDPQNFLFLVQSDNPGFNYAKFKNADYDKLMKDAENEVDSKKRAEILAKAEAIFVDEVPYASLLFYSNRELISDKVSGFIPNLRGAHATRFVSIKQ
ncbi:MAG: peptide ABC transporter substrate-binding protein [Proteobacteria bacterium]|nr:peptide ABC transporter substrate-binding protein [Pseudomonadota bacterium]